MTAAQPPQAQERDRTRAWAPRHILIVSLAVAGLLLAALLGGRLALLTPLGRNIVTSLIDGRKVGSVGVLRLYGLQGDPLHAFTLERATLSDARGVWLEARGLRMTWSPLALLTRRVRAETVEARQITLLRRPELAPASGPPGALPVSIELRRFAARLQLLEGFAKQYGQWTARGDLDFGRVGRRRGRLDARSLTRDGDFLTIRFDIGDKAKFNIAAKAFEARGGPLAGSLGYATDQPFEADLAADGLAAKGGFTARIVSGAVTPLRADGHWGPDGGDAAGIVSLAGSDLLQPWAAKLGPIVRLGLKARPAKGGLYALDAAMQADNLNLRAQGVADVKARVSRDGLHLHSDTPSASRLLASRVAGPARFDGIWRGGPSDWRLTGVFAVNQVQADGYSLARLAGPVDLTARQGKLEGELRLQGAGGAGEGTLARLLGMRPLASLAVTRLADGRWLARRLEVDGAALTVRARGDRGLTGELSLQGRAEIARLDGLRPGARGDLTADWRATQGGGKGSPWGLSLKAQGRAFASGLAQLDRLLGAEPTLNGVGRLERGVLHLERATLDGKALHIASKGGVGLTGALDLQLDWTAKGPFQVGPVELAGTARGQGRVLGRLTAPRADLTARFDQIDLPRLPLLDAQLALTFAKDAAGYDGALSLNAASAWGPARATSRFAFVANGMRLDQLSLDAGGVRAKGSVALTRGAPSSADLDVAVGPGAFLARGSAQGRLQLSDTAGTGASVDITGVGLALPGATWTLDTLRLKGAGALDHLPFTLAAGIGGPVPTQFSGSGVYGRAGGVQTLQLSGGGKVRQVTYRTLQPLTLRLAAGDRSLHADLDIGHGRLVADARDHGADLDAHATATGMDIAALGERLAGRLDATLALAGRSGRLGGSLDSRLQGVKTLDAPKAGAVDGTLHATLAGERLRLEAVATDTAGGRASASAELPVTTSTTPLRLAIARTQPISGRFSIQGEARPYWDLFQGGEQSLSGQVLAQGTIAGSLNAPALVGTASLQKASFEDAGTGLKLRNMSLDASFNHDTAVFRQFSAVDGKGGSIGGQGDVDLAKGGASSFTLTLRRFRLVDNDRLVAWASGPVSVNRGGDGKIALKGKLKIDRAEIAPTPPAPSGVVRLDVVELHAPASRAHFTPRPSGPAAVLDIDLTAPGQILVQGRGLNAELSLNAHVGGTSQAPILSGQAFLLRGDYTFAGRRFDFDPSGAIALSSNVGDIRLDLRAVYDQPSLTAEVRVGGTAAHPQIAFSSVPALPQDEILSQVLFGSSAAQLSGAQAAQLGAATAALAGGGGFDVLGNLREFAGLDVLTFGSDTASTGAGGLTVSGGKYIGNKLYLELIGGGQATAAARVEWRPLRNLSIASQLAGAGYSKIAVRWRKDFK